MEKVIQKSRLSNSNSRTLRPNADRYKDKYCRESSRFCGQGHFRNENSAKRWCREHGGGLIYSLYYLFLMNYYYCIVWWQYGRCIILPWIKSNWCSMGHFGRRGDQYLCKAGGLQNRKPSHVHSRLHYTVSCMLEPTQDRMSSSKDTQHSSRRQCHQLHRGLWI